MITRKRQTVEKLLLLLSTLVFCTWIIHQKRTLRYPLERNISGSTFDGFMRDFLKTSTFSTTRATPSVYVEKDGKPLCTLKFFRDYIEKHGYVPSDGAWDGDGDAYVLKECSFTDPVTDSNALLSFLQETGIRRIATLGDSNGYRYTDGFMFHLTDVASMPCALVKVEEKGNTSYFESQYTKKEEILPSHKACGGRCKHQLYQCTRTFHNVSLEVEIEHFATTATVDHNFKTLKDVGMKAKCESRKDAFNGNIFWDKPNKAMSLDNKCFRSFTFAEFLFTEYLKAHPVDLILWFLPVSHDVNVASVPAYGRQVEYLAQLARQRLPETTKVLWLTVQSHNDSQKPENWQELVYEGRYDINKQLDRLNRVAMSTIELDRKQGSNQHYVFMDLFSMSASHVPSWHTGGVHMVPRWYEVATGYIWNTLVNSKDEWAKKGTDT